MTQVMFTIRMDRAGRSRNDAEAILKPLSDELTLQGFSVKMTLKGLYGLACAADKGLVEKTFNVRLTPDKQTVPNLNGGPSRVLNNWTVSGPLVIPQSLRDLGATIAEIDQQRAVLRFP